MKKEWSGYFWPIDFLKAGAIGCVIIHHFVTQLWDKGFLTDGVIYMAIPVFFVVTGINYSMACKKRKIEGISGYYRKMFGHSLWRVLWPFLLCYAIEIVYHTFLRPMMLWMNEYGPLEKDHHSFGEMIARLPHGGYGPGDYYVPLFVLMLAVFPILLWISEKFYGLPGLVLFCLIDYYGLPTFGITMLARLWDDLIYVYLGIMIFKFFGKIPWWAAAISAAAGVLGYGRISCWQWFFVAGAVYMILYFLPQNPNKVLANPIKWVARASFDIYLMQRAYSATVWTTYFTVKYGFGEWAHFWFCILLGLGFYFVETNLLRGLNALFEKVLKKRCGEKTSPQAQKDGVDQ